MQFDFIPERGNLRFAVVQCFKAPVA